MALSWIPRGILNRLQHLCSRFLWKGHQLGKIFAWVKWEHIALPKKLGGLGMKNLVSLSKALVVKICLHVLTAKNLWTEVVTRKYINPLHTIDWIRRPNWNRYNISLIWHVLLNSIDHIRVGLVWRIGSRNQVCIGLDP